MVENFLLFDQNLSFKSFQWNPRKDLMVKYLMVTCEWW